MFQLFLIFLLLQCVSADPRCPDGFTPFENTQSCYKAYHKAGTYIGAYQTCEKAGGVECYLSTIHTASENEFIRKLYKENSDIWLGMFYRDGLWMWGRSGTPVADFKWERGMPLDKEHKPYAVMNVGTDRWRNVAETEKFGFVCKVWMKI